MGQGRCGSEERGSRGCTVALRGLGWTGTLGGEVSAGAQGKWWMDLPVSLGTGGGRSLKESV